MLGYFASQMHALPAFLIKVGANILLADCSEHESQPKSCSDQNFNFKFVRFRYQYNYMAKTNTGRIYSWKLGPGFLLLVHAYFREH